MAHGRRSWTAGGAAADRRRPRRESSHHAGSTPKRARTKGGEALPETVRMASARSHAMSLLVKIEDKTARLAIVGQGYVGLPLAVEFARAGFPVAGIDTNPDRVGALSRGASYVPDVPNEQLQEVIRAGRFLATANVAVLADQDVVVICVPTPLRKSKEPDISFVVTATEEVAKRF